MTPEDRYLATVADLQKLAARCPHVTQQDVLEIASMPVEELRRRAIIGRDWHGHFAHSLDGIKEIAVMPGSGIDGCRSHKEVRAIVQQLVARSNYTWEDDYRGRLKAVPKATPKDGVKGMPSDCERINCRREWAGGDKCPADSCEFARGVPPVEGLSRGVSGG